MKQLIKNVGEYQPMYIDPNNGIVWIEDGSTGMGISVHANIDSSGSVTGMKKLGYWGKNDRVITSHGWKYNIDTFVCTSELDKIVAENCQCEACQERRKK